MKNRILLILLFLLSWCFLSAYTTLGNDVYLKVLIKYSKKATFYPDGIVFFNGEELRASKIDIRYNGKNSVTVKVGNKKVVSEPYMIELSVPENFSTKKRTKQRFSGDIILREYKGKLAIMNLMNLESYTRYVVASEIGSLAPLEALKAQAIVSRTYAIYNSMKNNNKPWDLRADTYSQVFNTNKKIPKKIITATDKTAFMLLTYKNNVAFTPFSANHGGSQASAKDVWGGNQYPYLYAQKDVKYIKNRDLRNYSNIKKWIKYPPVKAYKHYSKLPNWLKSHFHWSKKISKTKINSRYKNANVYSIKVDGRDRSGRINRLILNTSRGKKKITSQDKIRYILGGIPSTLCIINSNGSSYTIEGKGYGHGVGLSQSGAYLKAYAGWNYKQIVKHYFNKCKLVDDFFFKPNEDGLEKILNSN